MTGQHRTRAAQAWPHRVIAACVCWLAFLADRASYAATQVLAPSDDTFINSVNPDNNNGGSGSLFTGEDGKGGLMRALVRFPMPAGLQGRVSVTGAQLSLIVQALPFNETSKDAVETLAALSQPWVQGNGVGNQTYWYTVGQACGGTVTGATWNQTNCPTSTAWTAPGGTVAPFATGQASTAGVAAGAAVVWDSSSNPTMTADVQGWIDSPATNNGWRIVSNSEGNAGWAQRFYSIEAGSNAPSLSVTYTCKAGFVESGTSCLAASAVPASTPWALVVLGLSICAIAFPRASRRRRGRAGIRFNF
jgi:hypothetical protein